MALRLIEIYHQRGQSEEIDFLLQDSPLLDIWHDQLPEGDTITKVLLRVENTEAVLDLLQDFFIKDDLRVVILPVEATLPRPEEPSKEEEKGNEKTPQRISIEELYQKMTRVSGLSRGYIVMAILASIVAGLGLLNDDVAVIIGSMVIAPLLRPNMSLALATALADIELAKKAILTNIIGFTLVLSIGIVMGVAVDVDPSITQIASRSNVSYYYIFIALATGIAGAYSITTGVAEALVGVMVAVALLPPLVTAGLLLGDKHWVDASGALLLCLVNIVSINLASVVTFVLQGIQPREWLETKKAQRAVRIAVAMWIVLLLLLASLIFIEQEIKRGSLILQ
jgi:uncharacterized hydrophobic protein (TIGR00341 family)